MGILDQFSNLSPDQTQGLLAAAAQMLQTSGPSLTPHSLGQVVGGGLGAYQHSLSAAQEERQKKALMEQAMAINGFKLRDAESDFKNQEAQRTRAEELRKFYMQDGQAPAAKMGGEVFAQAAGAAGLPGDNASLNKIVDGVNQGMSPQQAATAAAGAMPAAPGGQNSSIYQQRMAMAKRLRDAGFNGEADAQEAAALKFQPKVKELKPMTVGGKTLYVPVFEDGTPGQPVPYEVAEKLHFQNLGGKTVGVNPFTGQQTASYANTVDPNTAYTGSITKRGQDMVDKRAGETLKQGKIPAGYRATANGGLEAIPGGPAADKITSPQQKLTDAQDVLSILDQAEPLLDKATGSYAGAAGDQIARTFGVSTDGAMSAAQLKVLEGNLIAKQPKMSGPQSDKDVVMYRQMAGVIGDPTIPADTKRAAMKTIRDIAERNAGAQKGLSPAKSKVATLADIAATAKASGKTTAEVTAALRAQGYTIGGK